MEHMKNQYITEACVMSTQIYVIQSDTEKRELLSNKYK
jgi:hypothetical protein